MPVLGAVITSKATTVLATVIARGSEARICNRHCERQRSNLLHLLPLRHICHPKVFPLWVHVFNQPDLTRSASRFDSFLFAYCLCNGSAKTIVNQLMYMVTIRKASL